MLHALIKSLLENVLEEWQTLNSFDQFGLLSSGAKS